MNRGYKYDSYCLTGEDSQDKSKEFHDVSNGSNRRNGFILKDVSQELQPYVPNVPKHTLTLVYPTSVSLKVNNRSQTWNFVNGSRVTTVADISEEDSITIELVDNSSRSYLYETSSEENCNIVFFNDILAVSHMSADVTITLRTSTSLAPIVHFVCENTEGIEELIVNGKIITPEDDKIAKDITMPLNDVTRADFSIIFSENYMLNECIAYYNSSKTTRATLNSNGESFSLPLLQTYNSGNATEFWIVFSAKSEPTTDYVVELHITPQHISNFALYDLYASEPQKTVFRDYIPRTETEHQIRIAAKLGCELLARKVNGVRTELNAAAADSFILTLNSRKYGLSNPYIIEYESREIAEDEDYAVTILGLDNAHVLYNGETLDKIASNGNFKSVIYTSETGVTFDIIASDGYKFRQNPYISESTDCTIDTLMNEEMTEATVNIQGLTQDITVMTTVMLIPVYSIEITCSARFNVTSSSGTLTSSLSGGQRKITVSGIAEGSNVVLTVISDGTFHVGVVGNCSYERNGIFVDVNDIQSNVTVTVGEKVPYIDNQLVGPIVAQCAATYQYAKLFKGEDADDESDSYIYSNTSPFFKSTNPAYKGKYMVRDSAGNARIDCSTFVGMVLRGITYDKSPYAKFTQANAEWVPSTELPEMYGTEGWEFRELDRQPEGVYNDFGFHGYSSVRTAADQAKFLETTGYAVYDVGWNIDNLWYDSANDAGLSNVIQWNPDDKTSWVKYKEQYLCEMLQPGDILFWSKRSWFLNGKSSTLSRYGITYTGIPHVGDSITVTYDGRTVTYESDTESQLQITLTAATFRSAVNNAAGTYVFSFDWRQADRYRKISHVAIMSEKLDRYWQVTTASGDAYDKGDEQDETTQSGGVMYSKLKPYHMRYLCLIIRPNYRTKCVNTNFVRQRNIINYPPRWSSQLSSKFKGVTYTSLENCQMKLNGSKKSSDGSSTRYIRGTETVDGVIVKDNIIKLPPGVYEATIKEISGSISTVTQKSGTVYDYKGTGFSINVTTADGSNIIPLNGDEKVQAYVGHWCQFRIDVTTDVRIALYIGTNQYDFNNYIIEPSLKLLSLSDIEWLDAEVFLQSRGSYAGFDNQSDGSFLYSTSVTSTSITRSFCVKYIRGASYRITFDSIPKTINLKLTSTRSATVEYASYPSLDSSKIRFDTKYNTVTIHAGAMGDNNTANYILFGFTGFESGTIPHIKKVEYCSIDLGTASVEDLQPYFGLNDIVDVSIIQEVDISCESIPYSSYSITVKDDENIFNPSDENNATKKFNKYQMFEIFNLVCDYGEVFNPFDLLTPPEYYITKVATARLKSITAGNSNAVFNLIGPIEYYDNQFLSNNELLLSSSVSKVSVKEYLKRIFKNNIDVSAFNDTDMIITPFSTESKSEIARIIAQSFGKYIIENANGQIAFANLGGTSFANYDNNEPFKLSMDLQIQNPSFSQFSEPVDSVKVTVHRNNVSYSEKITAEKYSLLVKCIKPNEEGSDIDDGSNLTGYMTASTSAPGQENTYYDENGNIQTAADSFEHLSRYHNIKYIRIRYFLDKKCSHESLKFNGSFLDESMYKNFTNQGYKDLSYNLSIIDRDNAGNIKKSGCIVTDDFIDFWFTYNSSSGRLYMDDIAIDCKELGVMCLYAAFLSNCLISEIYGSPIESDTIDYFYQPLGTSNNEYIVDNPLITTTRQAEILAMYLYLVKNRRIYDVDSRWRGDCLLQPSDRVLTAATIGAGVSKTYENYHAGIIIKNKIDFNGGLTEETIVAIPQQSFVEKEESEDGTVVSIAETGISVSEGLKIR